MGAAIAALLVNAVKLLSSLTAFLQARQEQQAGEAIAVSVTDAKVIAETGKANEIDTSVSLMASDDVAKQLQQFTRP